jgi:hypothetical protein
MTNDALTAFDLNTTFGVTAARFESDWPHREMHPTGEGTRHRGL